jgi:hypothetical protein
VIYGGLCGGIEFVGGIGGNQCNLRGEGLHSWYKLAGIQGVLGSLLLHNACRI